MKDSELESLKQRLLAESFPRLQMVLLVSLAGAGAFLISVALLYGGVESMGVRYFAAALVGYLLFILLIRAWIAYQRGGAWRDFDAPPDLGVGDTSGSPTFSGGGGRFGGGGASDSYGSPVSTSHSALDGFDVDELALVVLGVVALLAGLIAVGFVVYASPILFAEVLVDAAVVGAAYRSARRRTRSHWLRGVFRRTWLPAAALCVFISAAGFLLQASAPEARSLGAVIHAASGR